MAWHKIAVIAGLCSLALVVGAPTAPAQKFKDARSALMGTDAAAAEKAAVELGSSKDAKAATGVLLDALALGVHPKVAAAALGSLATLERAEAFDTIAFYLTYRDTRVRTAAVTAMGALDDKRADNFVLAALSDSDKKVRAAAADVVSKRKIKRGIEPLMALLQKGDEATAPALAAMADNDLAVALGELIGKAPDAVLARTLGLILMRPSYGPESARVEVVRALGKVPGPEAIEQLSTYVDSIPENPPRQSRREAEATIENRLENM